MADVALEVPARAEYVGLVRMVVSALVLARRDVSEETVDDLSLAVSEACTLAVGDGSITVTCVEQEDAVVVDVHGVTRVGSLEPQVVDPFPLMQALVDEVEMGDNLVRLRLRCGPSR